ncbi:hypothetical protein [Rhizobium chutanense]|nr:hypothetical protein [Rhizobium chutanense]
MTDLAAPGGRPLVTSLVDMVCGTLLTGADRRRRYLAARIFG